MSRLGNGPFDDLADTAGFKGTDQTITVASTVYAIHGPYGIEDPKLGDLDALRMPLRDCARFDVMQALMGEADDCDAMCQMLRGVEDLYRRLAQLVGYRSDIHLREDPSRDTRSLADKLLDDDIPF